MSALTSGAWVWSVAAQGANQVTGCIISDKGFSDQA
jgi:hypothetical protein